MTTMSQHRIQFSLGSFLIAVALGAVAIRGTYAWHHWVIWLQDPPTGWDYDYFAAKRLQFHHQFTPFVAAFSMIAFLAAWYGIVHRTDRESILGSLCISFPLLFIAGPFAVLTCFLPLVTPFVGLWLYAHKRWLSGTLSILVACSWGPFGYYYLRGWSYLFVY